MELLKLKSNSCSFPYIFVVAGKIIFLTIAVFFGSLAVQAQLIEPASTFRNIDRKSFFRFHYDNDYFTKTDYYYSQGISIEFVHPSLQKFPLSRLLFTTPNSKVIYGTVLNFFGYTPVNTNSDSILDGDRPYSSAISLSLFSSVTDTKRQLHISNIISAGIFGPLALGERMQTNIHRWLNNKLPKGWQHQVANDVIVDYQLNIEKQIWAYPDRFLLNGVTQARLGTLKTKASAGINIMAGFFGDPYKPNTLHKKKLQLYLYSQARYHLLGYDALLQGGLFNRTSPYTIASSDVSRLVLQVDGGIALNYKKLFLTYSRSYIGKEFQSGADHQWGGISIGFTW